MAHMVAAIMDMATMPMDHTIGVAALPDSGGRIGQRLAKAIRLELTRPNITDDAGFYGG